MIIHELGTNSMKYGSLSAADGSLEITWALERCSENYLVLDWLERGGPPVAKSPLHGFGLTLIEREVSQSLGGTTRIEFAEDGLRVNLRIPLESG
jgi:two-component sensor histidine kinase